MKSHCLDQHNLVIHCDAGNCLCEPTFGDFSTKFDDSGSEGGIITSSCNLERYKMYRF